MVNKFIINWNKKYIAFIGSVRMNFRKCKIIYFIIVVLFLIICLLIHLKRNLVFFSVKSDKKIIRQNMDLFGYMEWFFTLLYIEKVKG